MSNPWAEDMAALTKRSNLVKWVISQKAHRVEIFSMLLCRSAKKHAFIIGGKRMLYDTVGLMIQELYISIPFVLLFLAVQLYLCFEMNRIKIKLIPIYIILSI